MLKSTGQFGRWFWNKMILNLVILEHHGKIIKKPCGCLQRGRLMWIPPKQRCSSRFWTLVAMEALTGRTDETTGKWWMMNDEHLEIGEETSIGWELQFNCRNILKCFELQQNSLQKASLRASNEVERNTPVLYPQKPRNIPKSVLVTLFRYVLGAFQWQRYLQEFISGCLRLQGAARAVDLLLMTKDTRRGRHCMLGNMKWLHPARLKWNLQITHLERKMIFQTSMTMFHVNLHGCISNRVAWIRRYDRQWCNMHVCIFSTSCFCRIVLS